MRQPPARIVFPSGQESFVMLQWRVPNKGELFTHRNLSGKQTQRYRVVDVEWELLDYGKGETRFRPVLYLEKAK
jgi:hypothetical protein